MAIFDRGLNGLARRIRSGERAAVPEFRRELEPQLVHIVGRVLRHGGASPLSRQIMTCARQFTQVSNPQTREEMDKLVRQVAWSLCDSAIHGLSAQPTPHVAPHVAPHARETVRL